MDTQRLMQSAETYTSIEEVAETAAQRETDNAALVPVTPISISVGTATLALGC